MNKLPDFSDRDAAVFWSNYLVNPSGCWVWRNKPTADGRAQTSVYGKKYYASRLAYKLYHGVDPGKSHVCHTCDNGMCINPEHLFLGDDKTNLADMVAKGRNRKPDGTHVTAGLTAEQVKYIRASGKSNCQLAVEFDCTDSTISLARSGQTYKYVNAAPVASPCTVAPALDEGQVREIRLSTRPVRQLSRDFQVDRQTIKKIQCGKSYKQYPWTEAEKNVKRELKPGNLVKFSEDQINEARKLRSEGWTNTMLAAKYGVSRSLVSIRLKG
jgi:hypothetical protein